MNKEDKELLLKDLCARLPYDIKVFVYGDEFDSFQYPYLLTAISKFGPDSLCKVYNSVYTPFSCPTIEQVKPYLRPMSSMTEEERNEFEKEYCFDSNEIGTIITLDAADWLNQHHFDYRGLIEKGLALEALEGMYKNE